MLHPTPVSIVIALVITCLSSFVFFTLAVQGALGVGIKLRLELPEETADTRPASSSTDTPHPRGGFANACKLPKNHRTIAGQMLRRMVPSAPSGLGERHFVPSRVQEYARSSFNSGAHGVGRLAMLVRPGGIRRTCVVL